VRPGRLVDVGLDEFRARHRVQESTFDLARTITRDYLGQKRCDVPPWAITSGNTPRTNANDVLRIGRIRTRSASTAASNRDAPSCGRRRRVGPCAEPRW